MACANRLIQVSSTLCRCHLGYCLSCPHTQSSECKAHTTRCRKAVVFVRKNRCGAESQERDASKWANEVLYPHPHFFLYYSQSVTIFLASFCVRLFMHLLPLRVLLSLCIIVSSYKIPLLLNLGPIVCILITNTFF